MKHLVKVTDFIYDRIENNVHTYDKETPNFVGTFEFENVKDVYRALYSLTRDFTHSIIFLDDWLCISTYDEGGCTLVEYKDYKEYINDIKYPIKEWTEDIYDERTNKDFKINVDL